MDSFLQEVKEKLGGNDDFLIQPDEICGVPVVMMGFTSLIDLVSTKIALRKNMDNADPAPQSVADMMSLLGDIKEMDANEAYALFVGGKFIIYFESEQRCVIVEPFPVVLNRSIESPTNENVLQ